MKAIYFGDSTCKEYNGVAKLSNDGSYWIFTSLKGDYIHTNAHELSFLNHIKQ